MKIIPRHLKDHSLISHPVLTKLGLTPTIISEGVSYAYHILDCIDQPLVESQSPKLTNLVELANLSSIVGNLLGGGIERSSKGKFKRNRPHAYPDLLSQTKGIADIEIKVALETNKPKGHLAKPGVHLTFRYILGNDKGEFIVGKTNRGDTVWIWEIRAGVLEEKHFNISNTPGDSGKTAVINAEGMEALQIIYCDLGISPVAKDGKLYKRYSELFDIKQSK